ncbi:Conserved hypothetical protein [Methylocystis sp. SC2]|nr:Conserved hypothetical protein [Methylocystis sp. SC2]
MFALSDADLRGRALGCGDGPASFNAEATALGAHVISVDPIYMFGAVEIEARIVSTVSEIMSQPRAGTARPSRCNNLNPASATRLGGPTGESKVNMP